MRPSNETANGVGGRRSRGGLLRADRKQGEAGQKETKAGETSALPGTPGPNKCEPESTKLDSEPRLAKRGCQSNSFGRHHSVERGLRPLLPVEQQRMVHSTPRKTI